MFNLFVAKVRVANNPETREAGDTTVTKFVGRVEVGGTDDKGYARTELVKFEAWNGLGSQVVQKFVNKGDVIHVQARFVRVETWINRMSTEIQAIAVFRVEEVSLPPKQRTEAPAPQPEAAPEVAPKPKQGRKPKAEAQPEAQTVTATLVADNEF